MFPKDPGGHQSQNWENIIIYVPILHPNALIKSPKERSMLLLSFFLGHNHGATPQTIPATAPARPANPKATPAKKEVDEEAAPAAGARSADAILAPAPGLSGSGGCLGGCLSNSVRGVSGHNKGDNEAAGRMLGNICIIGEEDISIGALLAIRLIKLNTVSAMGSTAEGEYMLHEYRGVPARSLRLVNEVTSNPQYAHAGLEMSPLCRSRSDAMLLASPIPQTVPEGEAAYQILSVV